MIIKADNFAENIERLHEKIEYLRLLGFDAYWVVDTNVVVMNFIGDSQMCQPATVGNPIIPDMVSSLAAKYEEV